MKSIITDDLDHCIVCGTTFCIQYHHVLFGSKRKMADEDGLVVPLCLNHHTGLFGVHSKDGHELDLKLKKLAEERWLVHYKKTEEDFIKRYGKNYL